MKKLLILILLFVGTMGYFIPQSFTASTCSYNVDTEDIAVGSALDSCLEGSNLVDGFSLNLNDTSFKKQIQTWVDNIALYLGVFAVGAIIFGGLMMTLSAGDDEKIKKAKDIVKWGMIGFVGIISVSAIINLVVKIMYSL